MADFYNPYHFVRAEPPSTLQGTAKQPTGGTGDIAEFKKGSDGALAHVTHDRYVRGTRSGRLVCRLETATPVFVGHRRTHDPSKTQSAKYQPFELNGSPAIPASSLRGMISAVAEAASSSALRVLDASPYSRRADLTESLSAIGLITDAPTGNTNEGYKLRPLTLPTLRETTARWDIPAEWRRYFDDVGAALPVPSASSPLLRAYIEDAGLVATARRWTGNRMVGVQLAGAATTTWPVEPAPHLKRKSSNGHAPFFLLGQRLAANTTVESWRPDLATDGYARGFLMALDISDETQRPPTKKYELFVPYPPEAETWPSVDIPAGVIADFEALAAERAASQTDSRHPFDHRARPPQSSELDPRYRLRVGDLVYFGIDAASGAITAVSFSSVWRRFTGPDNARRASAWSFFRKIDKELLPFNPERQTLTIAERVFGFVAEPGHPEVAVPDEQRNGVAALAGRVRFSHALHHTAPKGPDGKDRAYLPEVTLRALVSPKPPSPAMYFKRRDGRGEYIRKNALTPGVHAPQGRKFYLNRQVPESVDETPEAPWRTRDPGEHPGLKSEVQPLARGNTFYFHIDFDNLSDDELGLLCYAIEPNDAFLHKLGMGRAIGLGSVSLRVDGVFLVDRSQRYSADGFERERYQTCWRHAAFGAPPDRYAVEGAATNTDASVNAAEFRSTSMQAFGLTNDPGTAIHESLKWLGKPHAPVQWPTVADQPHDEGDTYKWFVINDQRKFEPATDNPIGPVMEFLKPLTPRSATGEVSDHDVTLPQNPAYKDRRGR